MASSECLFIVSQSSEPFSILLIDPDSGSSKWSFRGNELQSNKIQHAVFLGEDKTRLCVALTDKPIIVSIPMKEQKGNNAFCTKSILNLNPNLLVSHPTGDFMFITSENKLFTWEILNGQMLSIVEEHARSITVLKISACGNYLATASKDGAVKIFLSANLISNQEFAQQIKPIGGHNFHSLPVNDLFISNGTQPRILSVSDDHLAVLFSLTTQQILLKLSTNQPLTSCCMDPAETKIFIGSITGGIRIIDIQTEFKSSYHRIEENGNPNENGTAFKTKFENHECAVTKLCVNGDGTRLASADRDGLYSIWDIANGQCLRSGKMAGPIALLDFIQNCAPKQCEDSQQVHVPLVSNLQNHIPMQRRLKVSKHTEKTRKNDIDLQAFCNSLLGKINNGQILHARNDGLMESEGTSKYKRRRTEDEQISTMADIQTEETNSLKERLAEVERELARITQINSEMYQYVIKNFVDEETTN